MLVLVVVMILFVFPSCEKDFGEKKEKSVYQSADGVFVVNEGQFMAGNGDVSFYNRSDKSVSDNLFFSVNNRPPGDIPQYLAFTEQYAYLIVNNSNSIEVIDLLDFKVKSTIKGFDMPRQMAISGNKGYVSQMGSTKIAVIDLISNTISGYIEAHKSADGMKIQGNRLFVANWSSFYIDKPNNTIMVIDLTTEDLIDSVVVAKEPNSMVIDRNGKLWVLSSGGFMGEEYPALQCINTTTLNTEKVIQFPTKSSYPTQLTVADDGEKLYYIDYDVYRISINDSEVPMSTFINAEGRSFYGLGSDPQNGEIYVTDAKDFQQRGRVYRYIDSGDLVDSFDAGINPSGIYFYRR